MEDELNQYRKTVFAEKVTCVGVLARVKKGRTQLVLVLDNEDEITYKLVKELETKEFNEQLGFDVNVKQVEQVQENELSNYVPEIFTKIAKVLKEKGQIELRVSYSQSALKFDTDIVVYKTMRKKHVETIYSPEIHKDKERLDEQKQRAKDYAEWKKGKEVAV